MPRCEHCGQRWEGTHPHAAPGVGAEAPPPGPPAHAFLVPGYRVEEVVAHGGFGTLLAARRERDGLRVALKVAHAASRRARAQLLQEVEVLRAIGPPTVPEVYEAGLLPGGGPYLAMRFVSQPTLARVLARQGGPMPLEDFALRAPLLVDAVGRVHARGFLHGDLKPENLFLDEAAPAVGLFDFGLARPLGARAPEPPAADGTPSGGDFVGTVEYMAPEQCEGRPLLDARADLYSLGVILYEMLTGRPPFFGRSADVIQAHLSRRPPRPSELMAVSLAVDQVVLRCLAKEPSRRFESTAELRRVLHEALSRRSRSIPTLPAPAPARPSGPQTPTRRSVAALFFRSTANPLPLQKALLAHGGQLAWQEGTRFAGIFDPDGGANPVERAAQALSGLSARGLVGAAVVDVVSVLAQGRPGVPARYVDPSFSQPDRYPSDEDPPTPRYTAAALEALPRLRCVPVPERPGLFQPAPSGAHEDFTGVPQESGALVGRGGELSALVGSAARALVERAPTLVSVLGAPGHGKSQLAAALAGQLRRELPQVQVLAWRVRPPVQGDPESTLRMMLHRALHAVRPDAGPASTEAEAQARLLEMLGEALAAELWPSVAAILGWSTPTTSGLRSWAAAPGALRSQALRATGELLAALARRRPLCLLLDDAHLAEETALDALEYATLAESCLPLWVCVLAPPAFEQRRPTWGARAAHHLPLPLGPLPLASATELCRALLLPAEHVPTGALEALARRAQGIPLFLVELVRGLKRQGAVRQRAGGGWYLATDELDRAPELRLVEWLAERELGALSPGLAAHARLCALLGPEFTEAEVEGVFQELDRLRGTGDLPLDPGHATRRLLELGLLVGHLQEGLRFRNELVRATVAHALPPEGRALIHLAAFRHHAGRAGRARGQRLPLLALHAAAAGLREEAASLHLELAESSRLRHAYLEAGATYSRALELLAPEDAARRLTALRGRGLMRYRLGGYEEALADFAAARALARLRRDVAEEVDLLFDEATAYDWVNDYVHAEARVDEAQALLDTLAPPPPPLLARLRLGRGRALLRKGQWQPARAELEASAQSARLLGDAGYETWVVSLLLLGFVLPHLGCIDEAERLFEEVIATCGAHGDRLHLGSALNNRRNLRVARGDLAGALSDQERFMRLGRELGMVGWEYFAEYNMGELLYQVGDTEAAGPHVRRAVELEWRHPAVAPRPWGLLLRARLHAWCGRAAEARATLDDIRQRLAQRGGAFSDSEQVLLDLVDLATRDARPEEWRALHARSEGCSVEQEPLEFLEVQALARWRRGEREVAARLMDEALRLAERLPNIMRTRLLVSRAQVLS